MPDDFPEWAAYAKPSVTLIGLILLWTWESFHPLVEYRRGRWSHAARNVVIALINAAMLAILFGTITVAVVQWGQLRQWGLLPWLAAPPLLRFALAIVLLDFWMYVWHRLNHRVPLLWRSHRMHHADFAMDVTSATRFHLFEQLAAATLRLGVLLLLGIGLLELLVYETLVVAITMFHHANITLGWLDRPLRWLIVTPRFHQIHHSRERIETNSNYSVLFSVWDRVFGSYQMRGDAEPVDYGLDEFDDDRWRSLLGMLRMPFAALVGDVIPEQDHPNGEQRNADRAGEIAGMQFLGQVGNAEADAEQDDGRRGPGE